MEPALFVMVDSGRPRPQAAGGIRTHYYPMACHESKRGDTITYNYQGRVNDPNIVYHPERTSHHGKLVLNYQAQELTLCPTAASMAAFPFLAGGGAGGASGALVITHRPLTNGPVLYSCFMLSPAPQGSMVQESTQLQQLQQLFQANDSMKRAYQSKPCYVSMDDYVIGPPRLLETEHDGQPCMVLYYPGTIPVLPRILPAAAKAKAKAAVEGFTEGATALSNMISLDTNGNPHGYGATTTQCASTGSGQTPPDLSNLPRVRSSYSGNPVQQVAGATVSSDSRCKVFDMALQANISNRAALQDFVNEIFQYRKDNDGLNPYLGLSNQDCYQSYVDTFWGGEQNFLNYLLQLGVILHPQYNYWNAAMVGNGFDPASIAYNLDGMCYDSATVAFNTGRAQAVGYDFLGQIYTVGVADVSYGINQLYSGVQKFGTGVLNVVTGGNASGHCPSPTVGPSMMLQVPILDSPDVTYQECTMIPADESEQELVYLTSQQQVLVPNNSLVGMIFYFIVFLIIYFGTPFLYFFVMCTVLKHGFNYSGTATFTEYLRKPQNFLGLGKVRGISLLFNILYWLTVLIVWSATLIPGADAVSLNSVVILMVIGWAIGYIGVKNNPPPETCFY